MIDLDNQSAMAKLDVEDMLGHVAALPQQCRDAWALTQDLELPVRHFRADKIVIAGMGGSAIGGDLAVAVATPKSPIPIVVRRGYDLPAYVDRQTLVIASSYSGNTEETLSAFQAARGRGCPLAAIATGGKLAELATAWDMPLISFSYQSQPRAALGYMFVSLLGILRAMGVVGRLEDEMEKALALLESEGSRLAPDVPLAQNPAKQLASSLVGRLPIVIGSGPMEPVARRWKSQFNENSKGWSYFEAMPEMNHNAVSGIHFPAEPADLTTVLFLSNMGLHPRNRLRLDLTQEVFEGQGVVCQQIPIQGESRLAQVLFGVQLGDYASTYLAFLNGTDPTAISDIVGLKQRMSER
jgi:glucose/mannose-6-phosphate isomerase